MYVCMHVCLILTSPLEDLELVLLSGVGEKPKGKRVVHKPKPTEKPANLFFLGGGPFLCGRS